ncbi:hypothetical protein HDU83_001555 [Entophlyctis luteolus]|nr:hypothetical protein HDU83_001555 [Entophlyctis luteolus]KAJ3387579.1 hypothetical protein HDU84_000693 [Entophlyctis sp. JEL0112]
MSLAEFQKFVLARRSHRNTITPKSPISDEELQDLVKYALNHSPSSFSSQSARAILLLKDEHVKLWEFAKEKTKERVTGDYLSTVLGKLNGYQSGYGTVLIYDDNKVIEEFQQKLPQLKDSLPVWQSHASGIFQYVLWTSLDAAGLGASLQHQQAVLADYAKEKFGVPDSWQLVAQIPFGEKKEGAVLPEKSFVPVEERFKVFGN